MKFTCLITLLSLVSSASSTVVSVIEENDDMSMLYDALEEANLVDPLSGTGPFTVFAPNNEAFEKDEETLAMYNKYMGDDDWFAHLNQWMLYHVSPGTVDGITTEVTVPTLLINPIDNVAVEVTVSSDQVVGSETADNGIVHEMNTVFIPDALTRNLLEAAQEIPGFEQAAPLVTLAGLEDTLRNDLVTIFAPGEAAIANIDPTFIAELARQGTDRIAEVMKNHLVEGLYPSIKLTDGLTMTSFAGQTLTISDDGTDKKINDSTIISMDGVAKNGVAHGIDQLLIPPQ